LAGLGGLGEQAGRWHEEGVLVERVLDEVGREVVVVLGLRGGLDEAVGGGGARGGVVVDGPLLPEVEVEELREVVAHVDEVELAEVLQQGLNDQVAVVAATLVFGLGKEDAECAQDELEEKMLS